MSVRASWGRVVAAVLALAAASVASLWLAAVAARPAGSVTDATRIVFEAKVPPAAALLDGRSGDFAFATDGSGGVERLQLGDWEQYAAHPRPWIAFVRDGTLWAARPDGSNRHALRTLSTDEEVDGFAWAPDGRRIAVTVDNTAACHEPGTYKWCAVWHVEVIDVQGRHVTVAGESQNASWSPDGRYLLVETGQARDDYDEWGYDVVRADGVGEAVFAVQNLYCWSDGGWSPDGSRLLLVKSARCARTRLPRIHVIRTRGWKEATVHAGHYARWSAGGSWLAFVGPQKVLMVSRHGTAAPARVATVGSWAWAPRGPRIAYVVSAAETSRLAVAEAGTSQRTLLARADGRLGKPHWSPDGRRLALVRPRGDGYEVLTLAVGSRGLRRLAAGNGEVEQVVWAADSPWLAIVISQAGAMHIEVAAPGGGRRTVFADLPGAQDSVREWSRDDSRLRVSRSVDRLDAPHLFTIRSDGSDLRPLLLNEQARGPAWSPDGSTIAFWRADPKTKTQPASIAIYTVGADGRDEHRVIGGSNFFAIQPSWSPDGRQLAFTHFDASTANVSIADRDGTHLTPITATAHASQPTWSPDGQLIAFADDNGIAVVTTTGTDLRRVTPGADHCRSPAWAPDGRHLAIACKDGIVVVHAEGGGRRVVAATTANRTYDDPAWSPDGAYLVYSVGDGSLEVKRDTTDGAPTTIVPAGSGSASPDWSR